MERLLVGDEIRKALSRAEPAIRGPRGGLPGLAAVARRRARERPAAAPAGPRHAPHGGQQVAASRDLRGVAAARGPRRRAGSIDPHRLRPGNAAVFGALVPEGHRLALPLSGEHVDDVAVAIDVEADDALRGPMMCVM